MSIRRLRVVVQVLEAVDRDCALYSVTEAELELLCRNLLRDPFQGTPAADGRDMAFEGYSVTYMVDMMDDALRVTVTGIRPPSEIPSTRKVMQAAGRVGEILLRLWRVANGKWPRD